MDRKIGRKTDRHRLIKTKRKIIREEAIFRLSVTILNNNWILCMI